MQVLREAVEPEALLREVDAETRELQEKPGIRVLWEVGTDLLACQTDPAKLKIVMKNLIGNAIKFTDDGTVTVGAYNQGSDLMLSVSDTGIGIAPEALGISFEPFRQGDGSFTRRHGGVGLGLYIVSRLLELLGGSLSVDSRVGQGTTFLVRIPTTIEAGSIEEVQAEATGIAAA
jgi:signal transduction histidine kinase